MDLIFLTSSDLVFQLMPIVIPILFIIAIAIIYFGWKQQKQREVATLQNFRTLCEHYNLKVLREVHKSWFTPSNLDAQGIYEGRELHLRLFQKRKRKGTGKNRRTVYVWCIEFMWLCENSHNIELRLNREGFLNKLGKKLGMQDITTYNDEFDKRFMIKCNYKIFPVQMFTDQFCEEMVYLHKHFNFNNIKVSRFHLSYEDERKIVTPDELALLIRSLNVTLELAGMVDTFSPNQYSV